MALCLWCFSIGRTKLWRFDSSQICLFSFFESLQAFASFGHWPIRRPSFEASPKLRMFWYVLSGQFLIPCEMAAPTPEFKSVAGRPRRPLVKLGMRSMYPALLKLGYCQIPRFINVYHAKPLVPVSSLRDWSAQEYLLSTKLLLTYFKPITSSIFQPDAAMVGSQSLVLKQGVWNH